MYEERAKTLPDGRIEVIVSDPSTGQEVVRYYSPGAEPKVSLGDLVLKGGFLRDELMPPSVAKKDDLTPLATKEELQTATNGLLARSEVMDGDKIKSSLLPAPNVTAADGSGLLGSDGKIRRDLLPEGAGGSTEGGSVDLQPLEKRVAALEEKPAAEPVDLTPLSERVSALENAPKVADKSQEVTALQGEVSTLQGGISTLQGVVSEHATNIASNDRRITSLESRPTPESVNLQPLTERVEALEKAPKGTAVNLQPLENRVTALEGKTSILGEDGKVKADFLPDSCKNEHCEAQTLPSDVVRTADIEGVVRKSELFDTAHNMILPELIPEAEVSVKWLRGKGRPDKPETTEGAIVGDEEDSTRYLSTDGAGTGAWEWEKRGGVWHVVRGDTGWRHIKASTMPRARILFRRIGATVHIQVAGYNSPFFNTELSGAEGVTGYSNASKILLIPDGFKSCSTPYFPLFKPSMGYLKYSFLIGGVRGKTDLYLIFLYDSYLMEGVMCPAGTYLTVDVWPESLPGESAESICPTV